MKKTIIPIALALIVVALTVTAVLLTPRKVEAPVTQTTAVEAPQEPIEPTPVKKVAKQPEAPQKAPNVVQEPEAKSNEDLIAEYGWTNGSNRKSIDYIILMFPQYFTEAEREHAFAYLNEVAETNKDFATEVKTMNSIDMVKWYFSEDYRDESWVNVGKLVEVDTSYYE